MRHPGLFEQARSISPKLRSVSNGAMGRYLKGQGCFRCWVRTKRGWKFPPLSTCRDAWTQRFPATEWPENSPADWTAGEDPDAENSYD
jgi:hypothetical protein